MYARYCSRYGRLIQVILCFHAPRKWHAVSWFIIFASNHAMENVIVFNNVRGAIDEVDCYWWQLSRYFLPKDWRGKISGCSCVQTYETKQNPARWSNGRVAISLEEYGLNTRTSVRRQSVGEFFPDKLVRNVRLLSNPKIGFRNFAIKWKFLSQTREA